MDVFAKESQPLHLDHLFEEDDPAIPSSASVVPASTLPRKFTNVFATSNNNSAIPSSSQPDNEVQPQITPRKQVQETPLRKKSIPRISLPQIDEEEVEEATPLPPSKNMNVNVQAQVQATTPMRKQRFTQQKLPIPRPEGQHLQVQPQAPKLATTPQRKRSVQGTPMRNNRKSLQSLPQIAEEEDPLTHSIPSSSPIFAQQRGSTIAPMFNRATAKPQLQKQQQYLVPPTPLCNRSGNKGAAPTTTADLLPSSPGFTFAETPLHNAKTKTFSAATAAATVVDDTPIKSKLPTSAFATSTPRGGENNRPFGSSGGGGGSGRGVTKIKKEKDNSPVSIYQRLGWDDTDDDLA